MENNPRFKTFRIISIKIYVVFRMMPSVYEKVKFQFPFNYPIKPFVMITVIMIWLSHLYFMIPELFLR